MLHRSGLSEARKTGATDRIPGASVVKLRTEPPAAVRGEDRKEESGSQCHVVKEGALTIWR